MKITSSKSLNVFPIEITIIGKTDVIEGQLVRTNGPRIVERILAKLPVKGRISKQDEQLNITVNIKMGKEKAASIAKAGDIAYWPMGDAISIFLDEMEPYGGINIIGSITSNLDGLKNLRLGTSLKISQKQ